MINILEGRKLQIVQDNLQLFLFATLMMLYATLMMFFTTLMSVLCNFDDVLCKVDDTLCNFNDALCNIDDALCNIDDALCNFNNALCNFNDALCKSDRILNKLQCAYLFVLRACCTKYRLDIRFDIIGNIYQPYIILIHSYIAGNAGVTQECICIDYGEIFGFEIGI